MKKLLLFVFIVGYIAEVVRAQDSINYGVRYRLHYLYDKIYHRTYKEDRVTLIAPSGSIYRSYYHMGIVRAKGKNHPKPKNWYGPYDSTLVYKCTPDQVICFSRTGKVYETYRVFQENFVYQDTINIQWKIQDITKRIGGYTCRKAIGWYAGRNYTVWFTGELPYVGAPWKLIGLPGVVLEAEDESGDIRFSFTEIVALQPDEKQLLELPRNPSSLDMAKFQLLKKLFAETTMSFINESGAAYKDKANDGEPDGYPLEGVDGLWITNPMELE